MSRYVDDWQLLQEDGGRTGRDAKCVYLHIFSDSYHSRILSLSMRMKTRRAEGTHHQSLLWLDQYLPLGGLRRLCEKHAQKEVISKEVLAHASLVTYDRRCLKTQHRIPDTHTSTVTSIVHTKNINVEFQDSTQVRSMFDEDLHDIRYLNCQVTIICCD
jgi:hypothetical protein